MRLVVELMVVNTVSNNKVSVEKLKVAFGLEEKSSFRQEEKKVTPTRTNNNVIIPNLCVITNAKIENNYVELVKLLFF